MRLWKKVSIGVSSGVLVLVLGVVVVGYTLSAHIAGERLARVEASPHYHEGGFVNPERQAPYELTWDYLQEQFFGEQQRVPPAPLPVMLLPEEYLQVPAPEALRATWLGHSSVLIEMAGLRLLTDPVLSGRASPVQFAGPERFHPSPLPLAALDNIDAVLISHNHYDHMDEATVRHLAGQGTAFFLPLGAGVHLEAWDVPAKQIIELDWWETRPFGALAIVATPTRHYSGRGLFDYKETFWSSWSILGPDARVFFSGDSGYSKLFAEVGERFGPFDLNLIKIGSYGPGQSWEDIHMTPEDAVEVARDLGGGPMLPVHWATFNLGIHAWDEPIHRTMKAAAEKGVTLITPHLGETVEMTAPFQSTRWWEGVGK